MSEKSRYIMSRYAQSQRMIDEGGPVFFGNRHGALKEQVALDSYPFRLVPPEGPILTYDHVVKHISLADLDKVLPQTVKDFVACGRKLDPHDLVGMASEAVVHNYLLSVSQENTQFAPVGWKEDVLMNEYRFSAKNYGVSVSKRTGYKENGVSKYVDITDYDFFGSLRQENGRVIPIIGEVKTGRNKKGDNYLADDLSPKLLGKKVQPVLDLFQTDTLVYVVFAMPDLISQQSRIQQDFVASGGVILPLPFVSKAHALSAVQRSLQVKNC